MNKRMTYTTLIIVAAASLVVHIVSMLLIMSSWYTPLYLLLQVGFILAVFCSLQLCEKAKARVMHYVLIAFLGLCFTKNLLHSIFGMVGLDISLNSSILTNIELGIEIVLLSVLFDMDSSYKRENWMLLGAILRASFDLVFLALIRQSSLYTNIAFMMSLFLVIDALWMVGAIIMGIRGLKKPKETVVTWEEEDAAMQ